MPAKAAESNDIMLANLEQFRQYLEQLFEVLAKLFEIREHDVIAFSGLGQHQRALHDGNVKQCEIFWIEIRFGRVKRFRFGKVGLKIFSYARKHIVARATQSRISER